MEIKDYKPNSFKYKEAVERGEVPEAKKIVKGSTTTSKPSTKKKLKNEFFKGDLHDIIDYLIYDIAIPSGKKLIYESFMTGLGMTLGMEDRRRKDDSRSRVSYTRYYDERKDDRSRFSDRGRRDVYDYNEIRFDSKGDANDVLNEMIDEINIYGSTSVGRFYTMAGQSTMSTDYNYGWTNLRTADVLRNRDGSYSIDLPRAIPL